MHTTPERLAEYMKYLHDEGFNAIAMRDLAKYVDGNQKPDDPFRVIEKRKAAMKKQRP